MSLKTFSTPFTENLLGMLLISANAGTGFTLTDPGTYTLSSIVDWYHDTSDSQDLEDMDAEVAGDDVVIVVTDTPVTWYCKIEHVGDQAPLVFRYDQPSPSTGLPSDTDGNTVAGDSAGEALAGGAQNVALGKNALKTAASTMRCTAVGANALSQATGNDNTGLGEDAGGAVTTGTKNVMVGKDAGDEIQAGSGNILLGCKAGEGRGNVSQRLIVGSDTAPIDQFNITPANARGVDFAGFKIRAQDGLVCQALDAAPTDAHLFNNSFQAYLDEAGNKLMFRVRYSDGTYKTGEIALV